MSVETTNTEESYEDFRKGFRLSVKGNRWRKWEGQTLTLFQKPDGYGWCVAGAGGQLTYSPSTYPDWDAAKAMLWAAVSGDNQ